jgi:hypothetical protein
MRRRAFGRRAASIAGVAMLTLVVPPHSFAQTATNASGRARLPVTTIAENAVPADLSVSKDTASVSGGGASVPTAGSYAPVAVAPTPPVTASALPVSPSMTAPASSTNSLSSEAFPKNATMMAMPVGGPSSEVKAEIQELTQGTFAERRLYSRAAAAFPQFCQDWARMLRDRETNNLSSLNWQEKSGYETATYVGYSPIKTCQCKESAEGIPLGKVTYDEEDYYIIGKTIDEAKHASPKVTRIVPTLEIFSWDQNKWFY